MNEQARHTPGPWEILRRVDDDDLPSVAQADGPVIAHVTCWTSKGKSDPETIEANANLIAAAPELLDACKGALHDLALAFVTVDGDADRIINSAAGRLMLAIARAEGRV